MTRARAACTAVALLLLALGAAPSAPAGRVPAAKRQTPPAAAGTRTVRPNPAEPTVVHWVEGAWAQAEVSRIDGVPYVGANDLARLLDAVKFWRADTRKLVLRVRAHRLQFAADNPYALIDDRTVRLPSAVRSRGGELQIPVAVVEELPRDSTLANLIFDERGSRLRVMPPGGVVLGPRVQTEASATRLIFTLDHPERVEVLGRARGHFRIRFVAAFGGALPESLPRGGLVRVIRLLPSSEGHVLELALAPETGGFRLVSEPDARRLTLEFVRGRTGTLEAFAPEGPAGPRPMRVLVLDPGHGGSDRGVTAGDAVEKDLTLALARLVGQEVERRGLARVVLTRADDRTLGLDERAEAANRAHADVVLSLHFDGLTTGAASGATAYCPPALEAERSAGTLAPVALVPWRDVATRHAASSRALASAVIGAFGVRGLGPARIREVLPASLLGVNSPGLELECATLTSGADRARVNSPQGLRELANAIADGLQAYQRNE